MAKKNFKGQADAIAKAMPEPKPTLDLNSKKLAAIKDWEVGEEYELTVRVRMVEKRQGQRYPMNDEERKDKTVRAMFEIEEVKSSKEDEA